MPFTDHKISAFRHRIADLADQPNMTAAELKTRFDSSPEELRQAHNAACDEAARLDARVAGIVAETFGDTIPKSMLSAELAAEIDAKAEQTALAAEQAAREEADSTLSARVDANDTLTAKKCEIYTGTYTPSDTEQTDYVHLGFFPQAVFLLSQRSTEDYAIAPLLSVRDQPHQILRLTENGFAVDYDTYRGNYRCVPYRYIAFK